MEELIFFAVLIFFSIVESIARSRKQRKGGGPLPEMPPEREAGPPRQHPRPRPTQRAQQRSGVPSYDDDASFDARASSEEGISFEGRTSSEAGRSFDDTASSEEERRRRAASSESMIPADIWEEIAGLAREAKVELPLPGPRPTPQPRPQSRPAPTPQPRPQAPAPRKVPAPKPSATKLPKIARAPTPVVVTPAEPALEGTAAHAVHESHAGYGTDPSERARSAQDGLDPLARVLSRDASAVRQQLRGQGANALRQALILYEVLGPPAASRPDRFSE
jgi:hypothetical protein